MAGDGRGARGFRDNFTRVKNCPDVRFDCNSCTLRASESTARRHAPPGQLAACVASQAADAVRAQLQGNGARRNLEADHMDVDGTAGGDDAVEAVGGPPRGDSPPALDAGPPDAELYAVDGVMPLHEAEAAAERELDVDVDPFREDDDDDFTAPMKPQAHSAGGEQDLGDDEVAVVNQDAIADEFA